MFYCTSVGRMNRFCFTFLTDTHTHTLTQTLTHMQPCQWQRGDTTVLTGSEAMGGEWRWGKRRAENRRMRDDALRERWIKEREAGGQEGDSFGRIPMVPCIYFSLLSSVDVYLLHSSTTPLVPPPLFLYPSILLFPPPLAAVRTSHVIISSLPPNSSSSPLLSTLPRSPPFFINPLTLCGKWAHSPIQCLLRHDGRDFYIKTDKAGLGFRSTASQWGQTPRRLTVGWIGGRKAAAECRVCASWTELKFGWSRTSRCSRQRWWRRKMRCCRCLRFARP